MAEIVLSYSPADKDAAAPLAEALKAAGLDVAHSASDSLDADALDGVVERTPCVIVLWSANAAADPNRAAEVKLALSAWSADRLVLAVLDDSELPAGFRDLHTFNLAADRQGAIDGIVERAREMTSAEPRLPPAAKPTPPSLAKGRRPVLVMIGVVVMLVLAVIGLRSLWEPDDRTFAPGPAPGPSAPRPLEKNWYAEVWPWAVIGGGALLLTIGLIVVVRLRRARKQVPVPEAPGAAAAEPGPPQIFVSYSRQDTRSVDRIVEHIEGAGYTVWIDREAGGHGTQRYAAPIVRAIKSARLVALMCSRNAFASDHVVRGLRRRRLPQAIPRLSARSGAVPGRPDLLPVGVSAHSGRPGAAGATKGGDQTLRVLTAPI